MIYPTWFVGAMIISGMIGLFTGCFSVWMVNRLTTSWAVRYEVITSRYEAIRKTQHEIVNKLDALLAKEG